MDTLQLNQISTIHFGIPRTESLDIGYDLPYLQLTDVDTFGRINPDGIKSTITLAEQENQQAVPKPGDILLFSKGIRNIAVFCHHQYPKIVVSNSFYILRVKDEATVQPEFLACYLNLPATQKLLQSRVGLASTVPTLNKKDLLDFPIPVPPFAVQQQLIDLHNAFLGIYDISQQQLNLQQELLYQCFSTTLQTHR